jgi:hypothetical protein
MNTSNMSSQHTSDVETDMGEIAVKVKLENVIDRALHRLGQLEETSIRCIDVDALVDTGAVMLVVPEDVVHKLGIEMSHSSSITQFFIAKSS